MLKKIYLSLTLFAALPLWCQTTTNTVPAYPEVAAYPEAADESLMQAPPAVSGAAYSTETGNERQSNYLRTGLGVATAYNDNVLVGSGLQPTSDTSYSIRPLIAFDHTAARLHESLHYSPGFTFYQNTTSLNQTDQNLMADFQYRLSPHIAATARDTFIKTTNGFNQLSLASGGGVSGNAQPSLSPVVAPYADQQNNIANVELTYQFRPNSMVGVSGTFTNLTFPNSTQVTGLNNASTREGEAFFDHRLSGMLSVGAAYQYSLIDGTSPSEEGSTEVEANSTTQTHTMLLIATAYLNQSLTLSFAGGPQHYDVSEASYSSGAWAPSLTASMGWQGQRTTFSASYSHLVGAGGGLLGAFDSNSARAAARWQAARTWTLDTSGNYSSTKNAGSPVPELNPGGHMASFHVAAQHPLSERFNFEVGYTYLHQSYSNIATIYNAPNSNREYIAISYQITKPLGR